MSVTLHMVTHITGKDIFFLTFAIFLRLFPQSLQIPTFSRFSFHVAWLTTLWCDAVGLQAFWCSFSRWLIRYGPCPVWCCWKVETSSVWQHTRTLVGHGTSPHPWKTSVAGDHVSLLPLTSRWRSVATGSTSCWIHVTADFTNPNCLIMRLDSIDHSEDLSYRYF